MKYIIIFMIMLFTFGCTKDDRVFHRTPVVLPQVSSEYRECLIRYKNSYYDNSDLVNIRIRIINIHDAGISSLVSTKASYTKTVEDSLNANFYEAGFKFYVASEEHKYTGETISSFALNGNKYNKLGVITILVYHTEQRLYNGIAMGAPSTLIGVHASRMGSKTLPHEMGHALGLFHTFEPDSSDGSGATLGDGICDTPAYNLMDLSINDDCEHDGGTMYTEEELEIIIPNYLSYTGECRENLTPVQILVTRWYITNAPILTACVY